VVTFEDKGICQHEPVYRCAVRPCLGSVPGLGSLLRLTPRPPRGPAPPLPACAPLRPRDPRGTGALAARAPHDAGTGAGTGTTSGTPGTTCEARPTQHRTACRGSCPGPPLPERVRV